MKKVLIPVIVLVVAVAIVAYLFLIKKNGSGPGEEDKQQPLAIEENTGPFNRSFAQLLLSYYQVKDALVNSDAAAASAAAMKLVVAADSLKVDEIQGDSTGKLKEVAKVFTSTISSSATALAAEQDITAKRKEFEMIADVMWNLTRTVRYSGQKLYWQYCPMAFNNKGAYWMSNERSVKNPYFGDEMLECGSVEDSLDYSN